MIQEFVKSKSWKEIRDLGNTELIKLKKDPNLYTWDELEDKAAALGYSGYPEDLNELVRFLERNQ